MDTEDTGGHRGLVSSVLEVAYWTHTCISASLFEYAVYAPPTTSFINAAKNLLII